MKLFTWVATGSALLFFSAAIVLDRETVGTVYAWTSLLMKILGLVGSLAATVRLAPGDYLYSAWMALTLSSAFLVARDVLLFAGVSNGGWRQGAVVVTNILGPLGFFLLARAWRAAGLEPVGPRIVRVAAFAGGLLLALVLGGYPTVTTFSAIQRGEAPVDILASSFGDVVSLALTVPLVLTAIALRGGLLFQVWALLAASQIGWLLYDLFSAAPVWLSIDPGTARAAREAARVAACLYFMGAGFAQRKASGPLEEIATKP